MKAFINKFILLTLFLLSTSVVFGQTTIDSTKKMDKVIVKMKNGDEFEGVILKRDENTILLQSTNGELNLLAANVSSIILNTYSGQFSFANSHVTRYFFGPTGIPIKKGQGYYQNVLLDFNFINYGIADNFSIGGGFDIIGTFSGHPIWFFSPKIGAELSKNVHVGVGILLLGFGKEGSFTLGHGVFTFGTSESNLSIGAGFGLTSYSSPAITISGTHRVSNSIALLTENYVLPSGSYLGIQGLRILSRYDSFDIGLIMMTEIEIPLPFVGYARAF